ncbi:MAG: hypothetical protein QNJ77_05275 [Acidimicrobiia bacterium]|nr:hypothetical protein [Acidimicrobiia bacterium]
MQTLAPTDSRRRVSPTVAVLLAIATGLLAALAKRYLDFSLGIPGHAGVGWIGVLIAGRLGNDRPGMATIAGLSMGLWSVPVGLNHSMAYNTVLYGMAGALLDSGAMLRLPIHRFWGAMIAGTLVHLAKFGYIFANAWMADMVRNVEVFGLMKSLANHVVFGALGGLMGWAIWRTGGRLLRWLETLSVRGEPQW